MSIRAQNYVAAAPAVTAVGSAFRHEFLAPKTHTASPAIAGLRKNFYPIDEHAETLIVEALNSYNVDAYARSVILSRTDTCQSSSDRTSQIEAGDTMAIRRDPSAFASSFSA